MMEKLFSKLAINSTLFKLENGFPIKPDDAPVLHPPSPSVFTNQDLRDAQYSKPKTGYFDDVDDKEQFSKRNEVPYKRKIKPNSIHNQAMETRRKEVTLALTDKHFTIGVNFQDIHDIISIISDKDCHPKVLQQALENLLAFAKSHSVSTQNMLFDLGGVHILLSVLLRHPNNSNVFLAVAKLLEAICKDNVLPAQVLASQNGLTILLSGFQQSLHEAASLEVQKKANGLVALNKSQTSTRLMFYENIVKTSVVNSLVHTFLSKYRSKAFLDEIQELDQNSLVDSLVDVLITTDKFEKLFTMIQHQVSIENVTIHDSISNIIRDAVSLLSVERIYITLIDPNTKELVPMELNAESLSKNHKSLFNSNLAFYKFSNNVGLCGRVATSGQPSNISRQELPTYGNALNFELDTRKGDVIPYNMMLTPIKGSTGALLGVLQAVNKRDTVFTSQEALKQQADFSSSDQVVFELLAHRLGYMISNWLLYDDMKETQKKVEIILETTRFLSSTLNLEEMVKRIMDAAKELLNADRCTLFLIDQARKQLVGHIQGVDSIQEIRIPLNTGIAGYVATTGDPVNILDAYQDKRFNPEVDKKTGYMTKTILCAPIKNIAGDIIGVTQMINKRHGLFDKGDLKMLSAFSSQAAVSIEKFYLFKKNEDMRTYLESILGSISHCVLTLGESLMMTNINQGWVLPLLGVDEATAKSKPINEWVNESLNANLWSDIQKVVKSSQPAFCHEYELKGATGIVLVNYQILPLKGRGGIVLVIERLGELQRIATGLRRYYPVEVVKGVIQSEENNESLLSGTRKSCTVMQSDIRNFCRISETVPPTDLMKMLNYFFDEASFISQNHGGTVDKLVGDACISVFTKLPNNNHHIEWSPNDEAIQCCLAALKLREAIQHRSSTKLYRSLVPFSIGIGIHSGDITFGSMGKRVDFSFLGEPIAIVPVIEELTKVYNVGVIVTDATKKLVEEGKDVGNILSFREIDTVYIELSPSRSYTFIIYEMFGKKQGNFGGDHKIHKLYADGLRFYREKKIEEARKRFEMAFELNDDGPSKVFLDRCIKCLNDFSKWSPVFKFCCDRGRVR